MFSLKKEVRDIKRLNYILMILTKQGLGFFFGRLFRRKVNIKPEEGPKVLRETLEKLGPTFVKLGQILSLRPDLIPKEYVRELSKLQDQVPPFSYREVEKIINEELGKPISSLFSSFSKKPIASASVSQVHKANLKNGREAAVKVQRPNAKETMDADIGIMYGLAKLLEKHSKKIGELNPTRIVDEFRDWTEKELDFEIEANNARKFYSNFKGYSKVKIPEVFDDYSSKRVLTLEFIDGIELHNIDRVKGKKGYNLREIIKNGFDAIMEQVFVHGFFHADPHPSNILILKGNKIGLVDFGIVGHFDDNLKKKSIELFYGIVDEDIDAIADIFLDMGLMKEENTDIESFKEDIKKTIAPLQGSSLKDVKISHVLEEVLDIAFKHHVKLPIDFVLFGKTIVEIEGVGLEYEPDFKFVENARPFIEKLIKKQVSAVGMIDNFKKNILRYGRFIADLPDNVDKALVRAQQGTVKMDIKDTDIKKLSIEIDKSSNRMAYAMIIAAFLVTGALLINIGKPVLTGIPLPSLICFIFAVFFGLILLKSVLNERKVER